MSDFDAFCESCLGIIDALLDQHSAAIENNIDGRPGTVFISPQINNRRQYHRLQEIISRREDLRDRVFYEPCPNRRPKQIRVIVFTRSPRALTLGESVQLVSTRTENLAQN